MDEKARARLAELEEMERRWMEANRVFKCHGCGVELGHVDFGPALPGDDFKRAAPTALRIRRGPARPLGGMSVRTFHTWPEIEAVISRDTNAIQPATDLEWSPIYVDIWRQGIHCENCNRRIEPGTLDQLVAPFRYASELARLRRRLHTACNEPGDTV